ncbi:MAG: hypothetical protein LBN34_07090 [Clostridiales Family XIII bacterium]|jgi:hypothetical protein|nr:hypothetical protein [Clostridiales Family XIII bacterium]
MKKNKIIIGIAILLVIIVSVPIAINVIYQRNLLVYSFLFSADGILSYSGSIIAALATIAVAIIAVMQSIKIYELEAAERVAKRKAEIKPVLCIELMMYKNYFNLIISNTAKYPAMGLYTFDYVLISPYVKGEDETSRKFTFCIDDEADREGAMQLDGTKWDVNSKGYPRKINIFYSDANSNYYSQDFIRVTDNDGCYYYESEPAWEV